MSEPCMAGSVAGGHALLRLAILLLVPLAAEATEVIHYAPPATLPARIRSGHCWTSSIAAPYRQDAWRCMTGNEIHDPCFRTAQPGKVFCDMKPTAPGTGFQLKLTKPLPEPEAPPTAHDNWGWLIKLSDGATCQPFTGTSALVGDEAAHYGCTSPSKKQMVVLVGDLTVQGQTWTAKRAVISLEGEVIQPPAPVVVEKVWQ